MKTLRLILLCTTMLGTINSLIGQTDLLRSLEGHNEIYDWKVQNFSKSYINVLFRSSEKLVVRSIKQDAFGYDFITEIRVNEKSNRYSLIHKVGKLEIWSNGLVEYQIGKESRKEIEEESAELIETLFSYATLQPIYVIPNKPRIDGVDYFFTIGGEEARTAKIAYPKFNGRTDRLISFSNSLIDLAKNEGDVIELDRVSKNEIRALINEFK